MHLVYRALVWAALRFTAGFWDLWTLFCDSLSSSNVNIRILPLIKSDSQWQEASADAGACVEPCEDIKETNVSS